MAMRLPSMYALLREVAGPLSCLNAGRLRFQQLASGLWRTVLVEAGEYVHRVAFDDIEQQIREAAQVGSPNLLFNTGVKVRVAGHKAIRSAEVCDKGSAHANVGLAVPLECF